MSYKRNIDWYSLLGNKQVITQLHLYDIFVINTRPWTRVITKISYSYWVITDYNIAFHHSLLQHIAIAIATVVSHK